MFIVFPLKLCHFGFDIETGHNINTKLESG